MFQDEHGDFTLGIYIRENELSKYTLRADNDATIFVKLWQFDQDEWHQMSVDMRKANPSRIPGRDGASAVDLYFDDLENIRV